ncbi:glyoxylate/hydroxypyruvate reductase A [Phenylobacterium sp. LjRoot225]|uniref:2-hydroxyacid dehydrogenase n=1 Tax=Phenylobacterium sp. LjRoot225 TaxID=3342285 RepID=UPI003ECC9B61
MSLLYKADRDRGREWRALFAELAPDIEFRLWPEIGPPDDVRYLAAWQIPPDLLASLTKLEVLFSTGAGVDQFDLASLPPQVKLVRLIDPGIIAGMVEYVVWAALTLHRDMPDYLLAQREGRWAPLPLVPAQRRRIGVMGLGELGRAALAALRPFGFQLAGWNRSPRPIEGVRGFVGQAELPAFLGECDIFVCLLPLTAETRGILCRETLALLPKGAGLVNTGRGGHLVEADLLAALDSGQISAAVLDVAAEEPPAEGHPFYSHPKILLTPHIAAMTHAETAVRVVLDNIRRHESGAPMHGLVPRERGY